MEYVGSFSIVHFKASEETQDFELWYKTVWLKQNPKMDDFSFEHETIPEDGEVLTIMCYNPSFSWETLCDIYSMQDRKKPLKIVTTGLIN